jgi:hypothetical protein
MRLETLPIKIGGKPETNSNKKVRKSNRTIIQLKQRRFQEEEHHH